MGNLHFFVLTAHNAENLHVDLLFYQLTWSYKNLQKNTQILCVINFPFKLSFWKKSFLHSCWLVLTWKLYLRVTVLVREKANGFKIALYDSNPGKWALNKKDHFSICVVVVVAFYLKKFKHCTKMSLKYHPQECLFSLSWTRTTKVKKHYFSRGRCNKNAWHNFGHSSVHRFVVG